jgi:hypothetical protein
MENIQQKTASSFRIKSRTKTNGEESNRNHAGCHLDRSGEIFFQFKRFQFRGSGSFHFTLAQVEDPPQGENSSEVQYVSINPACFRFTSSFSLLVQRKRSKRKDALLFWFYLNSHHDWKSMNSLCSNSTDFLPS